MATAIRVASYNIHKAIGRDGRCDPARILSVLREIDADVVLLQEADRRWGRRESVLPRALLAEMPWQAAPVARVPYGLGWHGNAVLIRRGWRIEAAETMALPTLEPRGAVCVTLDTPMGRFRVVGTHLDLSGLRRRAQLARIAAILARRSDRLPTIIAGDFNQWRRHGGSLRAFADSWRVLTPGASFPARRPVAPLDRIVISPEWAVEGSEVHHSALAALASDHLPVSALLTLPVF